MALENLPVWSIPPNWADGITETLEWMTGILASPIGAEQRFSMRTSPRRSFEMTFTVRGTTRTLFDMFVERVGGADIYLPIWHDIRKLTVAASAGTSYLEVEAVESELHDDTAFFIQGANPWDYEIAENAGSTGGTTLITGSALTRTWPVGTRIYPMQKCRIDAMPQANRKADKAYQVRVKFSSVQDNPSQAPITLSLYNGYFVLETEPNDVNDLSYEYKRIIAELDNQTGKRARIQPNVAGQTVQQFTFFLKGRAKHAFIRGFLYLLKGRRYPIWVPTFFEDFEVVANISIDSHSFDVKRCGFTSFEGPFRGREHILIHLWSGARIYKQVLSSALIGDGSTERITLSSAFDAALPMSAIRRISFLNLCRLDQDSIEIVHHTDTYGVATVTTLFRGLPEIRNPPFSLPGQDDSGEGTDDDEGDQRVVYFEFQPIHAGTEYNICVGIADENFTLTNPVQLDFSTSFPALAGSAFVAMKGGSGGGGHAGWGYPDRMPTFDVGELGQWVGVLVLLDEKMIYLCNASSSPDTWTGSGGPTQDPETSVGGFDFSNNIPTGPIYILAGCGWPGNFGAQFARGKLNAVGPFVRSTPIPRNGVAWGDTTFNPADADSHIILEDGNHIVTSDEIFGSNQPTAFVRSIGTKEL
jgi:hypothetical protein